MEENVNNSETENVPGEKIQRISYVRRLDRTPEKDFNLRNEDEKKIVCERRKLTGKVKEKIDRLERELEDR
ncbi:hypothetical protein DPMN_097211 [Dreissena polymorpha]|uniref:Uncharacterized protein n=1 Tax=Dreissena polymorpha TaxID=45954 RepID=A0A9D4LAW1_DREPO|nr:hypothetical protein DPMN_097211 [Dreissena polymorpha]